MNPYIIAAGVEAKKKYDSVPVEKKKRAGIIILVIIFILVFRNKIGSAVRRMLHNDVDKIDVNKENLTFEKGEYFSMCTTLESSMNGTGTQDGSVMAVFRRLRTQDDWNFLQKCFGTRKKDGGTFFADITGDLKCWLADDMDSGEMDDIMEILSLNGITY